MLYTRRIFCVYILIFSSLSVCCQSFITIKGRLVDGISNEVISFGNIRVCGTTYGTLSNEWGEFAINITEKNLYDTLCISYIGYNTFQEQISHLQDEKYITVYLKPSSYFLSEVNIEDKFRKPLTPSKIVKKGIKQIDDLYPSQPHVLKGYYREYLKDTIDYLNLYEAVIDVCDLGFGKNFQKAKVNIICSRYRSSVNIDKTIPMVYDNSQSKYIPNYVVPNYGGNEFTLLRASDPIRNSDLSTFSYIYRLKRDFIRNHLFSIDSTMFLDTNIYYKIGIKLKRDNPFIKYAAQDAKIHGELYINAENFSIRKFRYINYLSQTSEKRLYEIEIEYRKYRDKLYLSYISMSNIFSFLMSDNTRFFLESISLTKDRQKVFLNYSQLFSSNILDHISQIDVTYNHDTLDVLNVDIQKDQTLVIQIPSLSNIIDTESHKNKLSDTNKTLAYILNSGALKIHIHNLTSYHGRPITKPVYKQLYQYQEFFVNSVVVSPDKTIDHNVNTNLPMPLINKPTCIFLWENVNVMMSKPLQNSIKREE